MGNVASSSQWLARPATGPDRAVSVSALERDLARARRQVDELERRMRAAERLDPAPQSFPPDRLQSPAVIMTCRILIGAIMAFPFLALIVIGAQRMMGGGG